MCRVFEGNGFITSGETVFIGGTKIEACANKYTFVWKKAVTKNQQKLLDKLAAFVAECEALYNLKIIYKNYLSLFFALYSSGFMPN